jgi:hypothetical protein
VELHHVFRGRDDVPRADPDACALDSLQAPSGIGMVVAKGQVVPDFETE